MTDPTQPANTHHSGPILRQPILGQVEDDLARVMNTLEDGVIFLDFEWRITYANQSARRLSRIRDEHVNGPSHWDLYPDTVGTELERSYRGVMTSRVEDLYSIYYEPFNLNTDVRILPIETGIALIYRDLTAQKREEEAKLAVTRRLEQVLEVTTDGVVYLDRGYNFTFVNRRAAELLAPKGDVLGANLWEAFPEALYEGSPHLECHRRSMEQRKACEFETYYPEPLNMWISVQSLPAENGIIITFRDISDEHNDKEALRLKQEEAERQRAEMETVYRTAPVGLALIDPVEFRYLRLNDRQAEFYGLPAHQIVGQGVLDGATVEGLRSLFEQVARGESVHDHPIEGELLTRPGEHRHWTVNYDPVFAADGSVQAISAVSIEITRQKRAEAALIQSEKLAAVGRLATSISHEINNPLESITNLLYLIATDPQLPQSSREHVILAQDELARVTQIATQTLRFHRQSVSATSTQASKLLGAVLNLYGGRLMNANVVVEARYISQTTFPCFENDIRQVLNNIIANAIDAMAGGGRLLVRSHDAIDHASGQRGVRLTIADTGHGMSAETQARAFEPFYTTKDLNGTGLGLWISADIVSRRGGRLRFRSSQRPEHHGTVFSVFQPLSIAHLTEDSDKNSSEGSQAQRYS